MIWFYCKVKLLSISLSGVLTVKKVKNNMKLLNECLDALPSFDALTIHPRAEGFDVPLLWISYFWGALLLGVAKYAVYNAIAPWKHMTNLI